MSDRTGLYPWIMPAPERHAPFRPPNMPRLDGVLTAHGCLSGNHELDGDRCRWCHTPLKGTR